MTWPTGAVSTVDVDASSDSPANARDDILSAIQKLNEIIANGEPVALAGNQSVAGTKTFLSSPIVPTPSAANHVARKDTVDAAAAAAAAYADALSAEVAVGGFRGLVLSSTGTNAMVSVSAEALMLLNGAGKAELVAPSLSINSGASGAGGLDTGTLAASTWYSVWVIWNGTTTSGLLSLSATTPTMPSGYTFKARVGWIRTDGTANKFPLAFRQCGKRSAYMPTTGSNITSYPQVSSGNTAGFVAVSISSAIPDSAQIADVRISVAGANSSCYVASSTAGDMLVGFLLGSGAYAAANIPGSILIPTSGRNIYVSASNGGQNNVFVTGWEDNL